MPMAKKKTKEQKIADLNDSIKRTNTKITNARNAIQNYQAKKDALQELYYRLETELEALEEHIGSQSDNHQELEGWRGDIYTGYQYYIAELSAKSENVCSVVEDRLEAIQGEINRLTDAIYENQLNMTRWSGAVSSYERDLFWARI